MPPIVVAARARTPMIGGMTKVAIVTAASRGVEVELFVSEIGDQVLVYHAQRSYYQALLEAGAVEGDEVRIGAISFEFTPERAEEE